MKEKTEFEVDVKLKLDFDSLLKLGVFALNRDVIPSKALSIIIHNYLTTYYEEYGSFTIRFEEEDHPEKGDIMDNDTFVKLCNLALALNMSILETFSAAMDKLYKNIQTKEEE
jgi:hypothetical protein